MKTDLSFSSLENLRRTLRWDPSIPFPALLERGKNHPYALFDELERRKDDLPPAWLEEIVDACLAEAADMPYDFRAELIRFAQQNQVPISEPRIIEVLDRFAFSRRRTPEEHASSPTDGIDHLFPIPETREERLALLRSAIEQKTRENILLLVARANLSHLGSQTASRLDSIARSIEERLNGAFRSAHVESAIDEDLMNPLISALDYWMVWDELIGQHTVAELLRIVLFSDDLHLPDTRVRPEVLRFYRSVLRISGRTIIGLRAGVFHVEHGALNAPSVFYMGRDSALGKGCVIDGVGGFFAGSSSFSGGGFIPILLHTHKHLRVTGEDAIDERKRILPVILKIAPGARFPMTYTGLYEAADYLEKPPLFSGVTTQRIDTWTS